MSEARWWLHLRADPSRFLLDDSEPGAVWRMLVEVLGRPHDSPAVLRARAAAREVGAAAGVLAKQNPLGYWGSPAAYGGHWSGTAWNLLALAALGADPEDPRIDRGAETLLDLIEPKTGGFAPARGKLPSACFTAEICAALSRFGFAHHPRVREAVAWLAERDGGRSGWSCPELRHLVDSFCPVAAVAALRFVAELPPPERAPVQALSKRAGTWLVERGLFLEGPTPHGWKQFAHPNLSHADLLAALAVLARVGWPLDDVLRAGCRTMLGAQDAEGRWRQRRNTPFGEPVGEPSRWLTLKALTVLSVYGERLPVEGMVT